MDGYKRQISYLDHMENGEKTGNAGFVKAEENNGKTRIEVRVKNLPAAVSGEFPLLEEGGGELGRISLNKGAGSCCLVWEGKTEEREDGRVKSGGLLIALPGGRMLKTVWKEPVWVLVQKKEAAGEKEKAEEEEKAGKVSGTAPALEYPELKWQDAETLFEPEMRINSSGEEEAAQEAGEREDAGEESVWREKAGKEIVEKESAGEERLWRGEAGEETAVQAEVRKAPLSPDVPAPVSDCTCKGDKWEQLCTMYPVIHPFGDGREYLSIAPADFVVLRQEYYKMTHNSFLLHGYYNYRHLILGRLKEENGWQYYLGVPGNFYHREKMVAEMFGFEAFEGEKDSAAPGDFGYFMKRVEI